MMVRDPLALNADWPKWRHQSLGTTAIHLQMQTQLDLPGKPTLEAPHPAVTIGHKKSSEPIVYERRATKNWVPRGLGRVWPREAKFPQLRRRSGSRWCSLRRRVAKGSLPRRRRTSALQTNPTRPIQRGVPTFSGRPTNSGCCSMASNLGGLTVGDFLLEKLGNMSKWVEAETGDSVMMNAVHKGGATLATAFAIEARKRKELIKNRDWVGLTESNLPASISDSRFRGCSSARTCTTSFGGTLTCL